MVEYRKKSYTLIAEKVSPGTELYNFLEDCHHVTTDIKCVKLTGTVGENWPITLEKLSKTYTHLDGRRITQDNIPEGEFKIATIIDESAETIFAEQVSNQLLVATRWGEVLTANRPDVPHGSGDYIAYANENGKPNPLDRWVINGLVFNNTYQPV